MYNNNIFNPLVSIVIPVYNGANYVSEAIESALKQTYKNIEVIVVNDGSTDNTEKIVKKYGDKIRYFYKENGGVASALNLGIKNMKGEYFSWLSHDDIYYPNKIERQIEELKNIDKDNILYSGFELINDKSEFLYAWEIASTNEYRKLNNSFYALLLSGLNFCSLLIPKKAFYEVDFFNEDLKCTQDYDLLFKIFKNGYKIKYMPEVLLQNRIHESQDTKRKLKSVIEEGNKLWIYMISNLSEDDYKDIFYNEYSLLLRLLRNRLHSSPYDKTLEFIDERLNILQKENKKYYELNNKISIIVNLLKSYSNINEIIDSIIVQKYDNIEIIFITNENIDYLIKDLKYLEKIKYKVLNSSSIENILDYIEGDFIQFINNGDILIENKFKIQLEEFIKEPSADILYCNYCYIKNNKKHYNKEKSLILNDLKQFENILYLWNNPIYIPLCSMLIKKYSLKNINLFLDNDYLTVSQLAFYNRFKFINQTLCYSNIFDYTGYYKALFNEMENTKFILNIYSKYICLDEFYKYKNDLLINYFSKNIKRPHCPIFLIDKNVSYIIIYLFCIKISIKRSEKLSYKFFLFLYQIFNKKGDAK